MKAVASSGLSRSLVPGVWVAVFWGVCFVSALLSVFFSFPDSRVVNGVGQDLGNGLN